MKSNKQRRAELRLRRTKRAKKQAIAAARDARGLREARVTGGGEAPCNPALLAPYNSCGYPPFVARGYYVDLEFRCVDCESQEIWRATQQKWWYEVAKGDARTGARRCRTCRRAERERKGEARRIHLEGVARKAATRTAR